MPFFHERFSWIKLALLLCPILLLLLMMIPSSQSFRVTLTAAKSPRRPRLRLQIPYSPTSVLTSPSYNDNAFYYSTCARKANVNFSLHKFQRSFVQQAVSKAFSSSSSSDTATPSATTTTTTTTASTSSSSTTTTSPTSLLLEGLNPSQIEAVTQPMHSVTKVIAGPGSGKTRVLACRVAYLLYQEQQNQSENPERPIPGILALTFTNKAAGEMKKRVESVLAHLQYNATNPPPSDHFSLPPAGMECVMFGTFHSTCARILRRYGAMLQSLPSVQDDIVGLPSTTTTITMTTESTTTTTKSTTTTTTTSDEQTDTNTTTQVSPNLDGNFAILDQTDQLRILRQCLKDINHTTAESARKALDMLQDIASIKEQLANGFTKITAGDSITRRLYPIYRYKLLTTNALDFQDLIYMTKELLEVHPKIKMQLRRQWKHILVDEFQDTSQVQMELIKLLTSNSLFVVGDADQSIYSWRGALPQSLEEFQTHFGQHDDHRNQEADTIPSSNTIAATTTVTATTTKQHPITTVYLTENYRSTSNIVKAAEKVISIPSMESKQPRRHTVSQRGQGPSPRVVACADERTEANFVVDTIQQMIADSSLGPESSVAIIYRTNAQSRHFEEACVKNNLPYVIRGGARGFYNRAEVKDCLCFLKWLANGNHEPAMIRAFQTPRKGIGEKAIADFKKYCSEVERYYLKHLPGKVPPSQLDILISLNHTTAMDQNETDALLDSGAPPASNFISKRAMQNFMTFSQQMNEIRNDASKKSVDGLLVCIVEKFGLLDHFNAISKSQAEFEDRCQNYQQLREAAAKLAGDEQALPTHGVDSAESPLTKFMDNMALFTEITEDEAGEPETPQMLVNLLTIHASKGMEFDAVFVVGLEEDTLPSVQANSLGPEALEEEKRICYVAMTRAKTWLILTWRKIVSVPPTSQFTQWRNVERNRSRFLDALVTNKKPASRDRQKHS